MADQHTPQTEDRFKPAMPSIPGVAPSSGNSKPALPYWLIGAGIPVILLGLFLAVRLFFGHSRADSRGTSANSPTISAAPAELPATVVPAAVEAQPVIAEIGELAKPWSSRQFSFRDPVAGTYVPAILIRLPGGSPASPSGYWSVVLRAAYGNCQLDYIEDPEKLKSDYGYARAGHPMIGNPCTRSLYDPLKYATLSGNLMARGAVVRGSDLRPPLSIEVKLKGKQIIAARME